MYIKIGAVEITKSAQAQYMVQSFSESSIGIRGHVQSESDIAWRSSNYTLLEKEGTKKWRYRLKTARTGRDCSEPTSSAGERKGRAIIVKSFCSTLDYRNSDCSWRPMENVAQWFHLLTLHYGGNSRLGVLTRLVFTGSRLNTDRAQIS